METRCSSMERIYKGTQLVVGNVKRSTISASTPFRLRWNIALSMLSPSLYEPLLGENRELGEIPDSTLITNPRLI